MMFKTLKNTEKQNLCEKEQEQTLNNVVEQVMEQEQEQILLEHK